MKYKKYFRKTSLKQKGVGSFFLNEISIKSPKVFLEVGVFHGVTARNVCELLQKIHGNDFKYVGVDLFEENIENKNVNLNISIYNETKILKEKTIKIKPLESICVNLTEIANKIKYNKEILNKIKIDHDGLLRRNFLVVKDKPEIISIDHI